jgi:hypothetical protein
MGTDSIQSDLGDEVGVTGASGDEAKAKAVSIGTKYWPSMLIVLSMLSAKSS